MPLLKMAVGGSNRQHRKKRTPKQCFYHRFGTCPYGDSCEYYHKPREVRRTDDGVLTITAPIPPKRTRQKGHCFCGAKTSTIPINRPLMVVRGGIVDDDGNRRQFFCCVCSRTGKSIHKC